MMRIWITVNTAADTALAVVGLGVAAMLFMMDTRLEVVKEGPMGEVLRQCRQIGMEEMEKFLEQEEPEDVWGQIAMDIQKMEIQVQANPV